MTNDRPHDEQVRAFRERRRRAAAEVLGEEAIARGEYDGPVQPPRQGDYAVPAHFAKTVPGPALRELHDLLAELRAFRDRVVGLEDTEILVLYNGDELVDLIRAEFSRWAVAHIERRLARPKARDGGSPLATWGRLMDEFGWWFDELACQRGSGHIAALYEVKERVPWELFVRTWADRVHVHDDRLNFDVRGLPEAQSRYARRIMEQYHWVLVAQTSELVRDTAELGAGVSDDRAGLRAELRVMAADLVEVQAMLLRSSQSQRWVELPGGLQARWQWELCGMAGSIRVIQQDEQGQLSKWLGGLLVDHAGLPHDTVLSWESLNESVLPWMVGLMRPIHAALVEAWTQVERPAPPSTTASDPLVESEMVAAACEALASDQEPDTGNQTVPRARVPAVRTVTLLALLERRFGCEVRQGKGSEITVWRPGGRKFTLPAHKRNWHYPAHLVRALLKAVGIPPAEFAGVVFKGG